MNQSQNLNRFLANQELQPNSNNKQERKVPLPMMTAAMDDDSSLWLHDFPSFDHDATANPNLMLKNIFTLSFSSTFQFTTWTIMKTSFFASRQICPFGLSFPSLFQNRGKFAPNFSPLIYNSINIFKKLVIPSNLLV
jgi:hypothetical protein